MIRALDEFTIQGLPSTIPLQRRILSHSDFRAGTHDTGFVERYYSGQPAISMSTAQ
jgi:biotin carboxylase